MRKSDPVDTQRAFFTPASGPLAGRKLLFVTEWRGQLWHPSGPLKNLHRRLAGSKEYGNVTSTDAASVSEGLVRTKVVAASGPTLTKDAEDRSDVEFVIELEHVSDVTPADMKTRASAPVDFRLARGGTLETLPVGFVALMGASGSGKSVLASKLPGRYYSLGEPAPGSMPFTPTAHSAVVNEVLAQPAGALCVVDSLRMATLGGGALGPGGIPRDMGFQLSQLDYACRMVGVCCIGVLNVMTDDARAVSAALEVISGSCTGVIDVSATTLDSRTGDLVVSGTASFRPDARRFESFTSRLSSNEKGVNS